MSLPTYSVVAVARTPAELAPPTLTELGPLIGPFSWVEDLRQPGTGTFQVNTDALTADIKARLLDLSLAPMEVWVYRNDTKVFAGPVVSGSIDGGVITLTARDLLLYLAYMVVPTDKTWAAVEQADIVAEMVDDWQALTYGDFGIDTSSISATGTTRTLTIMGATEFPVVLDEALRLANSANGFDIHVDPTTRALVIDSPSRGTDLSASVFLERGLASPQTVFSVAPGLVASELYAVGTGPGTDALTATVSDTGLRAAFGRVGAAMRFDPVADQGLLDDLAAYESGLRGTHFFQVSPGELLPVSDGRYEDFGVGDTVTYSFDAGLGLYTGSFRVTRRSVSVDADGTEKMSVEFT